MIRKPTDKDFRESTTVTVLRESKKIATEGTATVAQGLGRAYAYVFGGIMAFGLIMSLLPYVFGDGYSILTVVIVGFLVRRKRRALANGQTSYNPPATSRPSAPAPLSPGVIRTEPEPGYRVEIAALGRSAFGLFVTAIAIFVAQGINPFRVPAGIAGLIMLMLAFLLAARMFGDRTALEWDEHEVKVTGLLGSRTMRWADVATLALHSFSRCDVPVLFAAGTPHVLAIDAKRGRNGSTMRLLVPVHLMNLDDAALDTLLDAMVRQQAIATNAVPPPPAAPVSEPRPDYRPTPSSDPRESFDPDAIMARYLAERAKVVETARPDLAGDLAARPSFGRKSFGRRVA